MTKKLAKKDIFLIVLFTFFYAILVFYRLGSSTVPETSMVLREENGRNTIVLDFGKEINLSSMQIYLGYKMERRFSIYGRNTETEEWNCIQDHYCAVSPLQWNSAGIHQTIRYLGIRSLDEEAFINELLFLDEEGKQVLPSNVSDYVPFFDEQDLYLGESTYYDGTMFDECFYPRTAYEYLNGLSVYERTHPPLGKILIAIGIHLFGLNPFGWRVICALFGIATVPIIYLFVWRLTDKKTAAPAATFLWCTEFMHFTLSRIATLDIIVAFFILLMFYFMYRYLSALLEMSQNSALELFAPKQIRDLLLCGMATALAIATKWTGVYAAVGIAIIFFTFSVPCWRKMAWNSDTRIKLGKLFGICFLSFILLPGIVYLLSYIPFMYCEPGKGLLATAVENSQYMLTFHENANDWHPYASAWYEWLIDKQPLLDISKTLGDTKVSCVATFGNPIILWTGLISLLHNLYLWLRRKNKNACFLCIAYGAMLLPWLFITRTVFIYQYFICILLLILLLANSFEHLSKSRTAIMVSITVLSAVAFLLYFPVISGIPISKEFVSRVLECLPAWDFAV